MCWLKNINLVIHIEPTVSNSIRNQALGYCLVKFDFATLPILNLEQISQCVHLIQIFSNSGDT